MFEKILLAMDGSEHSRKAIPVAGDIARHHDGEVTVLHVREHELTWASDVDLETEGEAQTLVDSVVRELKDAGANAVGDIRRVAHGQTPRAILDVAEEIGAGMIVMGTRGLSDWGRLLMGSVAHKVMHLAECPVLIVR